MNIRKSALEYYQHGGENPFNYSSINTFLRSATDEVIKNNPNHEIVKMVNEIDSQMTFNETINDIIYYRGISTDIKYTIDNNDGVIINKAYTSCSNSIDEAKKYMNDSNNGCCILVFKIPLDIKTYIFENQKEGEVLIERNTQFVIDTENSRHPIYSAILSKWTYNPSPNLDIDTVNTLHDFFTELNVNRSVRLYDVNRK